MYVRSLMHAYIIVIIEANEEDEDEEEEEGGGESIFQETDFKLDEFLNRCVMNRTII